MTVAFYSPYPIGFWVTTVAFAGYLLATGWRLAADRSAGAPPGRPRPPAASAGMSGRRDRRCTWPADPVSGLAHMLSHPFIVHALIAGTAVAAAVRAGRLLRGVARAGLRR